MTERSNKMTLNPRIRMEKMYLIIGCTAWVLGLLLAGSDGPYMPWGNLLGILFFWCATVLLAHLGNAKDTATLSKKIHDHAPESSRCYEQSHSLTEIGLTQ